MKNNNIWALLQLFAEGDGAAPTGETPADAGQTQRAVAQTQPQDAAAENRLTWEQIMADPEYNRRMQGVVRARLQAAAQSWEKRNAAPGANAPEAQATQSPVPDSTGTQQAPERQNDQALRRHYDSLMRQGQAMQQVFPGFDLQAQLRDPAFARLTSPAVGLSVEDAYYALHRRELQSVAMQVAAQKTAEKLSNAIRAGTRRPEENGTGTGAPAVAAFDYARATPEQRTALKHAIRLASARGEKLYPGTTV